MREKLTTDLSMIISIDSGDDGKDDRHKRDLLGGLQLGSKRFAKRIEQAVNLQWFLSLQIYPIK